MSESVTTTSAPAAPASAPSAPSTASASPSAGSSHGTSTAQGMGTQGEAGAAPAPARDLGETDFDALVSVKVNGQEKKVSVKEAVKNYQLEQAAREKMRQVAEERQRLQGEWQKEQSRLREIKSNPEKLAEYLGLDLDSFAEERLAKKYERMQMDPHQREALEYKEKLAQYEAKESSTKQELLKQIKDVIGNVPEGAELANKEQLQQYLAQQKHIYAQEQARIQTEVAQAWLETGLPKYSSVGRDIAFQMLKAQKNGASLQPKEAAGIVKGERLNDAREIMSQMDAKAIQDFLGDDIIQKLRSFDVERVTQNKGPQFNTQNGPGQQPASPAPKKQLNQIEWRKAMGLDF
jgi:hypothetical protein